MSESAYSDLERPPLDERALVRALVRPGGLWREISVVAETGSTNADIADGAPEGTVLVAEAQTAGRGRLGRSWATPPRAGLTFSVLLRPVVPVARLTWLPLLTGVAVAAAVRGLTRRAAEGAFGETAGGGVRPALKWPNDVLVGERKLGGILVEGRGDAVVVGVGLNVGLRPEELPVPAATSLAIEGAAVTDRGVVLRAILREFERWYDGWRDVDGDPERSGVRDAYRAMCATLGQQVRVEMPGERVLSGVGRDLDDGGRLLVRTEEGREEAVSVGDVVHVRGA